MVFSIRNGACPLTGRSVPETAATNEALGHPALDFVGDASAGEAEVNGDLLLDPALPPLQEEAKQTAKQTRLADGARRCAVTDMEGVSQD
jgi:hypothetical protein